MYPSISSELDFMAIHFVKKASQVALVIKNLPANAGDIRDFPGSGRSPGGGNGNPLQYYCLENPMDRGTWWATVHGVADSQTRLKWLSMRLFCQKSQQIGAFYFKAVNFILYMHI